MLAVLLFNLLILYEFDHELVIKKRLSDNLFLQEEIQEENDRPFLLQAGSGG